MSFYVAHADPPDALEVERAALTDSGIPYQLVTARAPEPDAIIAAARHADVLLTYSARIPRAVIEQLERCRAIVLYGIGYDHVDVTAASEHGILVVNLPGYAIDEVSNHALLFVLACAKKLIRVDGRVRAGKWLRGSERTTALAPAGGIVGETLGLIGFGNIARALARKAQALGMIVRAYDPLVPNAVFEHAEVSRVSLDAVLEQSDYVSVHVPLLPTTYHLINEARLRQMKHTTYLINTSRGGVIDEAALARALRESWIAGAALDVFETEPLPADSPLCAFDNVILTAHTAWISDAARRRIRQQVGEELVRLARNEMPSAIVNAEVKGHSRLERL